MRRIRHQLHFFLERDARALLRQINRLVEPAELVAYPPHRSFYEVLADQLSSPTAKLRAAYTSDALMGMLGPRERRALAAVLVPSRLFRSGQVLAHMPYVFIR